MKQIFTSNILHNILEHKHTTAELNSLIESCYNISLSILKSKFSTNGLQLFYDGLQIEDVAMDAIIPLFVNNSEGLLGIERSMMVWDKNIDDEAEAEHFLVQIIWKRVEQTITKLLKERDPIFEKIHKTLTTCIYNEKLKKIHHIGTVYVLREETSCKSKNFMDDEFFQSIPSSFFKLKQIKLFDKIFEFIKSESNFDLAIPLNNLVKKIKFYYFQSYRANYSTQTKFDDNFIYNDIVDKGLKTIDDKIETYYVGRNKISGKDADYIMSSFNNISLDVKNGGIHGSLYSYLEKSKPSLTQNEFYSEYHNIMNYLFNQFKMEIVKNFE